MRLDRPHPGPRHLWSSSPFPQASDRKARLLHVAWTSAYAPATSRHSVHTERRTRPATHSSVPWKGGPVCPPPATPARGCGAACGHVQRGPRTDPVGLQALGVGGGVPSASRWVCGTPSSHRRGLGKGRRAARGGRASCSPDPWSWTGRAPPTATASGWGRLSRFSETQLVMGNPRWTVTWCPMAKQAVLFCQGQLTYQELLLKSRRILFCRRSWPCFGSPWARIAILPLGLAGIFIVYLFSALTSHANPKGPARSRGPRVRAAGDAAGASGRTRSHPEAAQSCSSPPHATPQTGRGGFQVRSVWPPPSERPPRCSGGPPRCRWPRCRPFTSDFAERALGECGLDVHAAAGPEVQQLEAEGRGRPLPLSRPPPPSRCPNFSAGCETCWPRES